MGLYLKKKVYEYVWDKDSTRRATITFVFNNDNRWEFDGCDYRCLSKPGIDDWKFLLDLASEVLSLNTEVLSLNTIIIPDNVPLSGILKNKQVE